MSKKRLREISGDAAAFEVSQLDTYQNSAYQFPTHFKLTINNLNSNYNIALQEKLKYKYQSVLLEYDPAMPRH